MKPTCIDAHVFALVGSQTEETGQGGDPEQAVLAGVGLRGKVTADSS